MKNLKKIFAVALTVAMLATMFMVPVFADAHDSAEKLETIEILVGGGQGVTPEYLAGPATRIVSAILLLKLTGLIGSAEMWNGTENFADADEAASMYAKTIMGYLKANPEVGFVGYLNKFMPNDVISAQMYYKVLLTALGYQQDVDFTWAGVIAFAESKGLSLIADKTDLTINDFAIATVEALDAEVKGTGMTLIEKLVDDGVVSEENAEAAGWVITPELAIASAEQTGDKEITVEFTTAVPAGATIKLKDGIFTKYSTAAWSADMMTVTLTTLTSLVNAKTYAVEVTTAEGVMTANVVAVSPIADSIVIVTNELRDATTDVVFSVKDQYGDDMGVAGTSVSGLAYKVTDATTVTTFDMTGALAFAAQATSKFLLTAAQTGVGDLIRVTLVYNAMVVTKDFTVISDASPMTSSIAFGEVAPLANQTLIFAGNASNQYFIPYTLIDQYGAASTVNLASYTWISTDTNVVNPATFAVDGMNKITFDTGIAGTAIITVLAGADLVGQISITVSGTSAPTVANIASPSTLVAAGETVTLSMVVADQYSAVLAPSTLGALTYKLFDDGVEIVANGITMNATTGAITVPAGKLAQGVAKIQVLSGATVIGSVQFDVYAQAVATTITGTSFATLFQVGGALDITANKIAVLDQYDRPFTGFVIDDVTITLANGADAAVDFSLAGDTITADADGADVVSVSLAGTNTFATTVTSVLDAVVTSYTLTPSATTIYGNADLEASAYHATLTLVGMTAGGQVVVLDTSDYSYTTNNTTVAVITDGKVDGKVAGTVLVYAWKDGGTLVASTSVIVAIAAPTASSIAFSATTIADTALLSTILDIIDQYGVDIAATATIAVASSNTAVIGATGIISDVDANTPVTITVISGTAISPTTVVTVTGVAD